MSTVGGPQLSPELRCCSPELVRFCRLDIRLPRPIGLNHLCSLSELVGASSIGHREFFGVGHFFFLCELRWFEILLCGAEAALLGAIEFDSLKNCRGICLSES